MQERDESTADLLAALEQLKGDYERLQGRFIAVHETESRLRSALEWIGRISDGMGYTGISGIVKEGLR